MKPIKYISFFCLLAASLFKCSCHEDPKPVIPDPCANKTASSAEFFVYETFNFGKSSLWQDYDTDTAITGVIYFQAKDKKADSYRWEVGAGVYTTSGFTVNFNDELNTLNIPVKLTVTKKGDTTCFKDQKGIYTKTRNITVIHPTKNAYAFKDGYYFGSYKGSDGLSDTMTVYLNLNDKREPQTIYGNDLGWFVYSDLFRRGLKLVDSDITGYRQVCFGPGDYNSGPQGDTNWISGREVCFTYFKSELLSYQSCRRKIDDKIIYRTFTGTYLTNQPK